MVFQNNRDRRFFYLKEFLLLVCLIIMAGSLSCTSSTGSSSSSGSATGTGWTVTVTTTGGTVSSSRADVLGVIAQVKDRNGSPAIKGTTVCVSALRGGFLNPSDTSGSGLVIVSICASTTNDIGQMQATYTPLKVVEITTGVTPGTVETTRKVNMPIDPGQDTISATAMGVSGSTTIQVTP